MNICGNPGKSADLSVGLGFATDPYQACESQFQLTLRSIEILKAARIPLQIVTKSDLVLRDVKICRIIPGRAGRGEHFRLFSDEDMAEALSRARFPRTRGWT